VFVYQAPVPFVPDAFSASGEIERLGIGEVVLDVGFAEGPT